MVDNIKQSMTIWASKFCLAACQDNTGFEDVGSRLQTYFCGRFFRKEEPYMNELEILDKIKASYQKILKDNLVGIYIHGSIAFKCFNWDKSDIDFLAVVSHSPSLQEKEALITVLLELDKQCPPKGLEMSVVLDRVCIDFQYPTPFELHFSNAHKEKCMTDLKKYCLEMHGSDKDLAAHIMVVRQVGITLCGKNIRDVFGEVPKADYLDSIKHDIEDAVKEINENPVYIILNLCRVYAYIRDGVVLSKEQGGTWGVKNLPEAYSTVIAGAKDSYCGNRPFVIDAEAKHCFADYMLQLIFAKSANQAKAVSAAEAGKY